MNAVSLTENVIRYEVSQEIVDDVVAPPYDVTPFLAAAHYGEQLSLLALLRQRPAERMRSVSDVVSADLFAGGGGASLGIEMATGRSPIVAVNHDWHAIVMHMANHPLSIHFHKDVWEVPPQSAVNGAKLDLLHASPDCFPAGTLILTSTGYRPVEQVQEGELVLTHQGRWRAVTSTMRSQKRLRTIRGYGHYGLRVSSEHPFWTAIRVTERTFRPSRTTHYYDDPEWTTAGELKPGTHFWASPMAFEKLPVPLVGGRGIQIDERLLWLAGRYVADGWTRLTDTRGELVIICSKHEAEDLEARLNQWARNGQRAGASELAWHRRELKATYQFSTNHRGLVTWLRENFGHLAHNKLVPGWIYGLSESERRAFLEGYLSGDGSDTGIMQCLSSVSKALAVGIRTLAVALGYVPGLYTSQNRDVIEGRKVNVRRTYSVHWRHEVQQSHRRHFVKGSHLFTPIYEIKDDDALTEVFNLSVEEDESYVADGIVVHNCRDHSRAKGGKPRDKDIRALAWVIVEWAYLVRPTVITGENVPEFVEWSPLDEHGKRIKGRKGEIFDAFKLALGPGCPETHPAWSEIPERVREYARKGCGYVWSHKILVAADFGVPTSRERLYFVARCDGEEIRWPDPTHGPGYPEPYHTAAECLDFEQPSLSIFASAEEAKAWARVQRRLGHKLNPPRRPLKPATLRRVREGMDRFVLRNPSPFVIATGHQQRRGRTNSIHDPLSTVVTKAEHYLLTPMLTKFYGTSKAGASVKAPMPTATAEAGGGHLGLLEPVLVCTTHQDNEERPVSDARVKSANAPFPTVTAAHRGEWAMMSPVLALCDEMITPLILRAHGKGWDKPGKASGVFKGSDPMPTMTATEEWAALTPVLIQTSYGERKGQRPRALNILKPLGTAVAGGIKHALAAPLLVRYNSEKPGRKANAHSVEDPLLTAPTENRFGLVTAFLAQHNGGENGHQAVGRELDEPMTTIAGNINKAVVEADLAEPFATDLADRGEAVVAFLLEHYNGGEWLPLAGAQPTAAHLGSVPATLYQYMVNGKAVFLGARVGGRLYAAVILDGELWLIVDIRMRMLTPRELARAQGFPEDYVLTGTKEQQVARIGNSVCPRVIQKIVEANFGPRHAPELAA